MLTPTEEILVADMKYLKISIDIIMAVLDSLKTEEQQRGENGHTYRHSHFYVCKQTRVAARPEVIIKCDRYRPFRICMQID